MTKQFISQTDKEILQFFGKINASISHELKNILAIISETTGFLDDLVQLARQGKPLELSILENSNKSISEEISRGFHTIRQMNKFAHSVDDILTETDVAESTQLAAELSIFLSDTKPVNITESSCDTKVHTAVIVLISCIYQIICILSRKEGVDEINIRFEPGATDHLNILFLSPGCNDISCIPNELIEKYNMLLGVELTFNRDTDELQLTVPKNID